MMAGMKRHDTNENSGAMMNNRGNISPFFQESLILMF